MRLRELPLEGLVLWGIGREGRSVLECLRRLRGRRGAPLVLSDEPLAAEEEAALEARWGPLRFSAGKDTEEDLAAATAVIKSPGISLYRPELAAALQRNPTLHLSSATRLWFAEPGTAARTVVVTGSKGKSTTAALVHHGLEATGREAMLGGNIGTPAAQWLMEGGEAPGGDWTAVLELSSYQLADLSAEPRIGVLTNIFEGHTRWHEGVDNYRRDKLRLLQSGGVQTAVLNREDEGTRHFLAGRQGKTRWYPDKKGFHPRGQELWRGEECWGGLGGEVLQGHHNLLNICAALNVLEILGADSRAAFQSFASFRGLPHRQEVLGEREGIRYVNDSCATIPEAAQAAIQRFKEGPGPLTVLVGGEETGQRWEALAQAFREVENCTVLGMPASGKRLLELLSKLPNGPKVLEAESLEEAMAIAKDLTPRGGTVLLSPAAPSYGQFRNFEKRGMRFRQLAGFSAQPTQTQSIS